MSLVECVEREDHVVAHSPIGRRTEPKSHRSVGDDATEAAFFAVDFVAAETDFMVRAAATARVDFCEVKRSGTGSPSVSRSGTLPGSVLVGTVCSGRTTL